jgi:curved DNA-binding protein CbpA
LKILGLRPPCTEAEAKKAYRRLAKEMHPDRGGDIDRFRNLAEQFEKALRYIQDERLSEAEFH